MRSLINVILSTLFLTQPKLNKKSVGKGNVDNKRYL